MEKSMYAPGAKPLPRYFRLFRLADAGRNASYIYLDSDSLKRRLGDASDNKETKRFKYVQRLALYIWSF
jgi:hypothetical protein